MPGLKMQPTINKALPKNPEGMPSVTLDAAHSPLKVLAHEELLRNFRDGESFRPIHLRIGIMGACNMRCTFCNFHSYNEEQFYDRFSYKDMINTAQAIELMREFAKTGGQALTFCGSGECTIHPGYADICREAHSSGLLIGLITNGSMLHEKEIADAIINTHTWVRVGMNAGTDERFAATTKFKKRSLHQILESIRLLRERAVAPDFRIGLNFVITVENYREIEEAARLAKDSGAHYVRFEPEYYSAMGHESIFDCLEDVQASLEKIRTWGNEAFEVSIPKLDRGAMDQTTKIEGDFKQCHYSRFVTAIGADGNLYPCPQVHLNSRYLIGNVIEDGYQTVLEGGAREMWEESNPMRTDLCKTCFYRPQNELLELIKRGDVNLEEALNQYQVEVPKTLHAAFV
jgi:radical SAM protein with 4Fe4S-binding SPASM domain